MAWWYRWASKDGSRGRPTPEECERDGYSSVQPDGRYPNSVLMRKSDCPSVRQAVESLGVAVELGLLTEAYRRQCAAWRWTDQIGDDE